METEAKTLNLGYICPEKKMKITVEDDINVPDRNSDINKVVFKSGMAVIDSISLNNGKVSVIGHLDINVLYLTANRESVVETVCAKLAFEDMISAVEYENLAESDIKCFGKVWDMDVNVINSRKISVRGIVEVTFRAEVYSSLQAVMSVTGEGVHTRTETYNYLSCVHNRKDIIRVKENMDIGKNKPNIGRIIYSYTQLRNLDSKCRENCVIVQGDIYEFCVYCAEDDSDNMEFVDGLIPFEGKIALPGVDETMLSEVRITKEDYGTEIRPDREGEPRIIEVEMSDSIDVKVYSEKEEQLIKDAYSQNYELACENIDTDMVSLVMKNYMRHRVNQRFKCPQRKGHILQVVGESADICIDEMEAEKDCLIVDGIVNVSVVYICQDDDECIAGTRKEIPFEVKIDIAGLDEECSYSVLPCVETLLVTMSGEDEIDVKISLGLDCLVTKSSTEKLLSKVTNTEVPVIKEPVIKGIVVAENETVWDIAKKNHCSMESILAINNIEPKDITFGTRLIIADSSFT